MTAQEVKDRLRVHYPGGVFAGMPGPWTVIEEWRNIDFLAWSAWGSKGKFMRIGHEIKVSRADLRSELLDPGKRVLNVNWCHEFYFVVPSGLLTEEELDYQEPEWEGTDFLGERCPGLWGKQCQTWGRRRTHYVYVPLPYVGSWTHAWDYIVCPTCKGRGVVQISRVEREAPTCWVPRDVGLLQVSRRGVSIFKRSPRRTEVPHLSDREFGQLVRWISMRPDLRHHQQTALSLAV
jgi:hypothetical protein